MNLDVSRNRLWKAVGRRFVRVFVGVIGMLVLLVGIVMIVTPGPALVVIPMGLGILATQFAWARRLLLMRAGEILADETPAGLLELTGTSTAEEAFLALIARDTLRQAEETP